jgi:hypothetical protein
VEEDDRGKRALAAWLGQIAFYDRAGLTDAGRVLLAAGNGAVEIYGFVGQGERRPAR